MHHSIKRVIERVDGIGSKSQAQKFLDNAREKGYNIGIFALSYPEFYYFLLHKENALGKIIKVYKGFVIVCNRTNRTGTGVTTLYSVDCNGKFDAERIDQICADYEREKIMKRYISFRIWGKGVIRVDLASGGLGVGGLEGNGRIPLGIVRKIFKENFPRVPGVSYCLKEDGYIERDFKPVGVWSVHYKQ